MKRDMLATVISDQASIHHITGRSGAGHGGYHCDGCGADLDIINGMWHHPEQQAKTAREYLAGIVESLFDQPALAHGQIGDAQDGWELAIRAAAHAIRTEGIPQSGATK